MDHKARKADHIRINLEEDVRFPRLTTGLERYRFVHQGLPDSIWQRSTPAAGLPVKTLRVPLLISSMTGGTDQAERINRNLAVGAQARSASPWVWARSVPAWKLTPQPTRFGSVVRRLTSCCWPTWAQCSQQGLRR